MTQSRSPCGTALLVIRWWFGTTYVLAAIGGVIAAPIMIWLGNGGGVYMWGGAPTIGAVGWLIHPWGLEQRSADA